MSRVKVKVKSLEKQVQAVEPAPEPPNPKVKAVKKPKKAKKAKKKVKKPSRGPMGRPSKFTPEVRELIILSIRTGNYIETAAAVAGISKETFYSWMHKGEADDAPKEYSDFSDAIKAGRAEAEVRSVAAVRSAADGGAWQAAAWWLERSFPSRFGRTRIEVTGNEGGPVRVEIDAEALEAKVRALVAKEGIKTAG